jgi:hypothetical protein
MAGVVWGCAGLSPGDRRRDAQGEADGAEGDDRRDCRGARAPGRLGGAGRGGGVSAMAHGGVPSRGGFRSGTILVRGGVRSEESGERRAESKERNAEGEMRKAEGTKRKAQGGDRNAVPCAFRSLLSAFRPVPSALRSPPSALHVPPPAIVPPGPRRAETLQSSRRMADDLQCRKGLRTGQGRPGEIAALGRVASTEGRRLRRLPGQGPAPSQPTHVHPNWRAARRDARGPSPALVTTPRRDAPSAARPSPRLRSATAGVPGRGGPALSNAKATRA